MVSSVLKHGYHLFGPISTFCTTSLLDVCLVLKPQLCCWSQTSDGLSSVAAWPQFYVYPNLCQIPSLLSLSSCGPQEFLFSKSLSLILYPTEKAPNHSLPFASYRYVLFFRLAALSRIHCLLNFSNRTQFSVTLFHLEFQNCLELTIFNYSPNLLYYIQISETFI